MSKHDKWPEADWIIEEIKKDKKGVCVYGHGLSGAPVRFRVFSSTLRGRKFIKNLKVGGRIRTTLKVL